MENYHSSFLAIFTTVQEVQIVHPVFQGFISNSTQYTPVQSGTAHFSPVQRGTLRYTFSLPCTVYNIDK